jgi:hypothetical protein
MEVAMRAFVVRPFGSRDGIDFDAVGDRLIAPALEGADYSGNTTQELGEAGSIHEDMFLELLEAQLVIADISIHSANVFYELGIRHALRPRATILLRARSADASLPRAHIPFDIHGLRYCAYDPDGPESAIDDLRKAISDTEAVARTDSPVYRLLPDLVVDAAKLRSLPLELTEQIEAASREPQPADLRLLAEDVTGMRFEQAALRRVASALTAVGDDDGAIDTWIRLRIAAPNDYDANHQLATLYARQNQLTRSDQTIARALANTGLTTGQRSELHALRGSNLKRHWRESWSSRPAQERQHRALRSARLVEAITEYTFGFEEDLDNYYAGLNALALSRLRVELAELHPRTWRTNFATDAEAAEVLSAERTRVEWLAGLVRSALQAKSAAAQRTGAGSDPWLPASVADAQFLAAGGTDDDRVIAAYEKAAAMLDSSQRRSVIGQLTLYAELGLRTDLVARAIAAVDPAPSGAGARDRREALVFIGHMIDREGEPERFPESAVPRVRAAILDRVRALHEEAAKSDRALIGLAGVSDGGDILFHEACREAGVPTRAYLPVPDEMFRSRPVLRPDWLRRYRQIIADRENVFTMNGSPLVPSWLDLRPETSSWPRFNRWILHHAKVLAGAVTVLALWDNSPARGLGGVANMVEIAPHRGAAVDILDMVALRKADPAEE